MTRFYTFLAFASALLISKISLASHIHPQPGISPAPVTQADNREPPPDSDFNQELQWRILNLLARQLLSDDPLHRLNPLYLSRRVYATQTFTVDFLSLNPELLQVQITDTQLQQKTRLQIPRL